MRMTQFPEFTAFVAVAEEMSFTRAAKRLGMSLAYLSQTVRKLEEHLGVRLLNRTTRSVALTDAGQRMLAQLRPLLDGFDAALESVNTFRDKPAGHLRLTATPCAAKLVLAPLLGKFSAQYPEISIEVVVDSGKSDLVASHFDAGIHRGERVAGDMIGVRITHDYRFVTVASPDYLVRHGRPQSPSDLQNHNCIRLRLSGGELMPWGFVVNNKTIEIETHGRFIFNDIDLAVRTALEGAGVLYVVEEFAAPMVADGRLVYLLGDFAPPNSGLFLYYPSRRQNPAALRALIDFIRKNAQGAVAEKQLPASGAWRQDDRGVMRAVLPAKEANGALR